LTSYDSPKLDVCIFQPNFREIIAILALRRRNPHLTEFRWPSPRIRDSGDSANIESCLRRKVGFQHLVLAIIPSSWIRAQRARAASTFVRRVRSARGAKANPSNVTRAKLRFTSDAAEILLRDKRHYSNPGRCTELRPARSEHNSRELPECRPNLLHGN
jgi:hypothetical protein